MASEKNTTSVEPVLAMGAGQLSEAIARNHTAHDQRDMKRMGKQQEFMRSFRMVTSIAFTSCVMGTWEILLTSNTSALIAGGLAGLWWQFVWCYVGQTFVVLSLSEMASMAPTAGGQYHWVSEFAPKSSQKALSYASGWLSTLAWQAFVAVDSYICAAFIQALITLNNPDYTPQRWQTTLLMIAVLAFMGAFNVFLAKWLALIEGFFAVLHFVAWVPVIIVLWTMTPVKQPAKTVFTDFSDNGAGWSNLGLTVCIGQVGAMFTVVGSDASAHMAEEIRDAGVVVPRSMWFAYLANIPPTIIILATYVFCIGDLETTLSASTGFPVISVFEQSTRSKAGATGLTILMLLLLLIISTSCMASTVRQTFAFARDNGPVGVDPTPTTMNWAVLIFGGVMIIAAVAFVIHAKDTYAGPVSTVEKLDDDSIVQ
ncbi:hypothetical protein LTR85_007362 [Meristemomyces frigidus]|nr:hypothetical protein LTR85_007362 [Meristemomyces frigidus]